MSCRQGARRLPRRWRTGPSRRTPESNYRPSSRRRRWRERDVERWPPWYSTPLTVRLDARSFERRLTFTGPRVQLLPLACRWTFAAQKRNESRRRFQDFARATPIDAPPCHDHDEIGSGQTLRPAWVAMDEGMPRLSCRRRNSARIARGREKEPEKRIERGKRSIEQQYLRLRVINDGEQRDAAVLPPTIDAERAERRIHRRDSWNPFAF